MAAKLLERKKVNAVVMPEEVIYIKNKNGKYIYKAKFSEHFYILSKEPDGMFILERWEGDCNC